MEQQSVPPKQSLQNVQFSNQTDTVEYGAMSTTQGSTRHRKKFVLCFDGTGNKFSGTDADSNILKIYRMLDRDGEDQYHYYQPGIGTYVTRASGSLTRTSRYERFKSWYAKAKDSAVGTSFDQHVMGGYRFLMRYYIPGDDIFFFGFSRGAYTARFLAEMLDHVGLLSAGNEEMCQFAWKTFQKWQCRLPENEDKPTKDGEKSEKRKLLDFMFAFRETFSRPVRPIRFLGLFDTVNSVPHFENAWMQRTKFPYTAQSSARVIRHAVSIDERRAKFRQDLIGAAKPDRSAYYKHRLRKKHIHLGHKDDNKDGERRKEEADRGRRDTLAPPERFTPHQSQSPAARGVSPSSITPSMISMDPTQGWNLDEDEGEQDIQEMWFPGCHADIGGGWPLDGDDAALSHVPLVWMVREAQRAGLEFDEDKLDALNCCYEESWVGDKRPTSAPTIEIDPASPLPATDSKANPLDVQLNGKSEKAATNGHASNGDEEINTGGWVDENTYPAHHKECEDTPFAKHLHAAATLGRIHDVLQFKNGVPRGSVVSWNVMEYMPFRRMDLQKDGTWKAITWPLPKGETRDIPANAWIHSSAIKRMIADPKYRPGNLIVGGGGRGVRTAPKKEGIGKWVVHRDEGNAIGECFVRKELPKRQQTDEKMAEQLKKEQSQDPGAVVESAP